MGQKYFEQMIKQVEDLPYEMPQDFKHRKPESKVKDAERAPVKIEPKKASVESKLASSSNRLMAASNKGQLQQTSFIQKQTELAKDQLQEGQKQTQLITQQRQSMNHMSGTMDKLYQMLKKQNDKITPLRQANAPMPEKADPTLGQPKDPADIAGGIGELLDMAGDMFGRGKKRGNRRGRGRGRNRNRNNRDRTENSRDRHDRNRNDRNDRNRNRQDERDRRRAEREANRDRTRPSREERADNRRNNRGGGGGGGRFGRIGAMASNALDMFRSAGPSIMSGARTAGRTVMEGARTAGGNRYARIAAGAATGAGAILGGKALLDHDFGSVSTKYETGGKGVDAVSSGSGDHGGVSYGKYQLATNTGSMAAFMKSDQAQEFAPYFEGMTPGSAQFTDMYKKITAQKKGEMEFAQQDYIVSTHYDPAMRKLQEGGLDFKGRSRALNELVMSTATQYGPGGAASKIQRALAGRDFSTMTDEEAISVIQDNKGDNVGTDFRSSSVGTQQSVAARTQREKIDLLAMLAAEKEKAKQDQAEEDGIDLGETTVTASPTSTTLPTETVASVTPMESSAPIGMMPITDNSSSSVDGAGMAVVGTGILADAGLAARDRVRTSRASAASGAPIVGRDPIPANETRSARAAREARFAARETAALSKGATKAIPVLGTALTVAQGASILMDDSLSKEEKQREGSGMVVGLAGAAAGAQAGSIGGAAVGAAAGSVVPILGTAIGGVAGGLIGGAVGGYYGYTAGDELGRAGYDKVTGYDDGTSADVVSTSSESNSTPIPPIPLMMANAVQPQSAGLNQFAPKSNAPVSLLRTPTPAANVVATPVTPTGVLPIPQVAASATPVTPTGVLPIPQVAASATPATNAVVTTSVNPTANVTPAATPATSDTPIVASVVSNPDTMKLDGNKAQEVSVATGKTTILLVPMSAQVSTKSEKSDTVATPKKETGSIVEGVAGVANSVVNVTKNGVNSVIQPAASIIGSGVDAASNVLGSSSEAIASMVNNLPATGAGIVNSAASSISPYVMKSFDAAKPDYTTVDATNPFNNLVNPTLLNSAGKASPGNPFNNFAPSVTPMQSSKTVPAPPVSLVPKRTQAAWSGVAHATPQKTAQVATTSASHETPLAREAFTSASTPSSGGGEQSLGTTNANGQDNRLPSSGTSQSNSIRPELKDVMPLIADFGIIFLNAGII